MKRYVMVVVMLAVVGVSGFASERPPADQPGDDETMEITVGEARRALWYKEQYEVLVAEVSACKKERDQVTARYVATQDKARRLLEAHEKTIEKLSKYRTATVALASVMAVEAVAVILLFLLRGR